MYRDLLQKEGNLIGMTDLYVNMEKQEIYMNGYPCGLIGEAGVPS